jgi:hypothetical protein
VWILVLNENVDSALPDPNRLREAGEVMAEREARRVLDGRVEIDDVPCLQMCQVCQRYLAEVQYRFNRRFDLTAILPRFVRAALLTRPRPETVIRMDVGG